MRTEPSAPPDSNEGPRASSAVKAPLWPVSSFKGASVSLQSRIVPSPPPEAIPIEGQTTAFTSEGVSIFASWFPLATFQMLNDLSLEPQTSLAPSGEKLSAAIWLCAAAKVRASLLVGNSHNFTLPSSPPVASHLPSELTATFTPASGMLSPGTCLLYTSD